ncbi:MAG: tripartite tricarboxylate transporter permease, partial [Pseudomonadota bacterium]
GVGEDIGAWASYAAARRTSRERDEFGKGSVEGLTAAETGNSAVVPGALIPALTLAVPGSAPAAVLIAALFIHGVRPGPMIMIEQPQFVYLVVAMMLLATIAVTVFGLLLARPLLLVLRIPREKLMPVVFVLCVIGPFAITQRMFDVYVMLFFGIAGFLLRRMDYPMAPLVLGIILGDLLDKNLRRGLTLSDGDLSPFFTRPISALFAVLIVLSIVASIPTVRRGVRSLMGGKTETQSP